ncbi:hypothetical protein PUNSTDRAFT_137237 [Punctularia strigosozonata HHB-11173 SS5]|uniref:uncharacterized protein n=1 Tax=Punctularia strigosozonata (strain HHB-11173) TaxID=741275 RepID=UPI0004417FB2|nr:uncharacterized protein PUNSTDRAFT_137237 [Punctularia strigosozonata HHB-11173 SS5]EIN05743.1 hypothetical protein PUNSTDRAFT_137237 [Punctularia strigosozonata HHB-11173 SS5]
MSDSGFLITRRAFEELFNRPEYVPLQTGGPKTLLNSERYWVDRHAWFSQAGYTFRRRYQPNWVPSWAYSTHWRYFDDGLILSNGIVMDATRRDPGRSQTRGTEQY